jgi:hypothetical protein
MKKRITQKLLTELYKFSLLNFDKRKILDIYEYDSYYQIDEFNRTVLVGKSIGNTIFLFSESSAIELSTQFQYPKVEVLPGMWMVVSNEREKQKLDYFKSIFRDLKINSLGI